MALDLLSVIFPSVFFPLLFLFLLLPSIYPNQRIIQQFLKHSSCSFYFAGTHFTIHCVSGESLEISIISESLVLKVINPGSLTYVYIHKSICTRTHKQITHFVHVSGVVGVGGVI